jgi:hypothetical protein
MRDFATLYSNVVATKNPTPSFFTLNHMSKDAEFQGLSESAISFLGRQCFY